jgi:PAS domain S-box-containing protein
MKVKKTGQSRSDREKETVRRAEAQSSATPAASQENEESLQTFFNALDDPVFVFEPEGRILFTNPAAQNLLGYTPSELAVMNALDLHPPEQRQEAAKLLAGMIAGKIMICPIPLQARDGTRIPVETKVLRGQWRGKKTLFGISHDITERKRAPERLTESRNYLYKITDSLAEPIFVKDRQHRWVLLNTANCDLTGHHRDELLGKSDHDFFPKSEADVFWLKDEAVFTTGEENINEEKITDAKGEVHTIITKKTLYTDEKGEKFIVGISNDITERKRVEQDLQKFEFSIDQASDAIFWMTREAGFSYVNEQACRSLGYTREELMRLHLWDIDPVFPKERWDAEWKQFQENKGGAQHIETFHRHKDGSVFPVSISSKHLWFGHTELHVAVARDITERKQAEETIVHERQLLRTLIDLLPETFYIKDLDSRFLVANEALAKHFGKETASQILGLSDADFFPAELADKYRAEEVKVFGGEPLIDHEGEGVSPDGRECTHLTTKVPFRDSQGRIQGLVGIGRDITERKRAEGARRKSEKRYGLLFHGINDAVFVHSLASDGLPGRFSEVNDVACRRLGYTRDELLRMSPIDIDAPESRALVPAMMQRLRANKHAVWEGLHVCKDGRKIPVEISNHLFDLEGEPTVLATVRDITERKQAEEAVRQSEERYRALVETAPDVVYIISDKGIFVSLNPVFEAITGWARAEWLGKPFAPLLHPEDVSLAVEMFQKVLRGDKPPPYELRILSKSGKYLVGEFTSTPYIKDGKVAGKLGIVRDITERKRAEEALRQGEVRLEKINRCLLELGPNFDSNINRLTALCGELLGATCALYNRLQGDLLCSLGRWQTPPGFKSEDAPTGHICYDVIRNNREDAVVITNLPRTSYAESDPNVRAQGLQTYMGCAVKCEGKAVGSLCVVYSTDYRPTDDDRRILGIIASAIGNEDTRKQAEAELNRLMTAIEQTPESVVITDTQGRILYVNPVFERVTGYSRAEAIGQNPRLLKSNRQESAFYRELWAKINAGEVWRGRFINKKKDGTLFTEDAVIAPVRDEKGAVTNYIAIKRDISRELELEVQYRQTQKIDSIGRLAGGVAHDFNNILAVICGHTDLALAQLSPDAPLRSNLECIQESAERAANLIRQLLTFARRQVIEPRRINLNELIVNLNKMLHRLIGEDIKLVTQAAPDLGQIKADPGQIEQVLLNLVVNARDAMPDGGTLTIRTDNVTLDENYARRHLVTPGDYVMVSVSDTGVGMTDEVKQHIFEPFFTTKEQGKGTGLGLATCFGIIQQSNGHIHSESQVDKGTQFKIYLPRVQGVEDSISNREVPVSLPQGTETILLAEDEPSLRQLMARVLRTQGYTVLEAADGHEALTLAQANGAKIQLLLTDVIMPGLSGKTLAEWLGQVNPAVRVLFISGHINNNAVRDSMSKPGTFFLQKPFNPLDLTKKVREAIEAS